MTSPQPDPLRTAIKIGFDEMRLTHLGASILLGFHVGAPFLDNFQVLSPAERSASAVAFVLMVVTVAGLIMPAAYHRIAEGGAETAFLLRVMTAAMAYTLLPFAIAIGLDIFLVAGLLIGDRGGAVAGAATFLAAAWFWYGLGRSRRGAGRTEEQAMPDRCGMPPIDVCIDRMLTEARVILPGVQALLGFQLSIALTTVFETLPSSSKTLHAIALGAICLAMILLMTPAAYHRLVGDGDHTEDVLRVGSRLVTAATVPLAVGLSLDAYVVIAHVAASPRLGIGAGLGTFVLVTALWLVFPVAMRHRRQPVPSLSR
jgi:hypothetical protein